jgi:ribosome-associated protein
VSPRKPTVRASAGTAAPAAEPTFAFFVYERLVEKRAEDVVWLDVRRVTDLADDFLIATVQNTRQAAALVEECEKERKRRALGCIGVDARPGSGWIVLDYGDLVVHLFLPEPRKYYQLESLWADARRVK